MNRAVVRAAWDKWGTDLQLTVVVEECAELIQAISKHKRGLQNHGELALEVADMDLSGVWCACMGCKNKGPRSTSTFSAIAAWNALQREEDDER